MSGTIPGGIAAARTNVKRYGSGFYARTGRKGGVKGKKDGVIKGFASNPELAVEAGRLGGTISRRTPTYKQPKDCTFCSAVDHIAYNCPARLRLIERRRVAQSRQAIRLEEATDVRTKLSGIASKYGTKRPW